jgi:serine/threonine-protein kinase
MASVFRARDTWFGVECAVKLLLPASAKSQKTRSRFLSEARTMAVLDHPNVIRVLDVGDEEGQFYFVMEYAAGGSLADLVRRRGPRAPHEALGHVFHVLRGLDYAHVAGVVHRDIKPHNMLLTAPIGDDGLVEHDRHVVKLTDFGIARLVASVGGSRITGTGDTLGTLAYMSPEQRADPRNAGPESDVYGVGATLYLLLTGRRPFDLAMSHLDPTVYDRLPDELRHIVRRATAQAPQDRYATARAMAEEVADAWEKVDRDLPATAAALMDRFALDQSDTMIAPGEDPSTSRP